MQQKDGATRCNSVIPHRPDPLSFVVRRLRKVTQAIEKIRRQPGPLLVPAATYSTCLYKNASGISLLHAENYW